MFDITSGALATFLIFATTTALNYFFIALFPFSEFASPLEEAMQIMDRVRSFLSDSSEIDNQPLPWEALQIADVRSNERAAKIEAIEEHLGVFPDGTEVPLTIRQKLFFGDSLSKLHYKIRKVRHDCREIVEVIESFEPWEDDVKNTRLIRHFILECLSPFKRHTLELTNSTYDEYPTGGASWFTYIGSWIVITGTLVFYIYWIFDWGVYQGESNLTSWGQIYGTFASQDILLVQFTKVYILYYLPSQAMQPQLLRIRKVLSDVSMSYINRKDDNTGIEIGELRSSARGGPNESNFKSELSVVQHLSAACRAAWSDELNSLPTAWLLRQVRLPAI